jgi:hypothetical protein
VIASLAAATSLASSLLVAAAGKPDDSKVSPGIAGFLVTFGLALATWFLIRSMVKHLRKVRYSPEPQPQPGPRAEHVEAEPDTSAPGSPAEIAKPRTRPEAGDP